jgi:hypothetical protein
MPLLTVRWPSVAGWPQPKIFPFIDDDICAGKQEINRESYRPMTREAIQSRNVDEALRDGFAKH